MSVDAPLLLVVDDEPMLRGVMRLLLEPEGYAVAEAADLSEATAAIGALAPRLVLLDVRLGRASGLELVPTLRADVDAGAVGLIVLSAVSEEQVAAELPERTVFLRKPFDLDALLAAVRTLTRTAAAA